MQTRIEFRVEHADGRGLVAIHDKGSVRWRRLQTARAIFNACETLGTHDEIVWVDDLSYEGGLPAYAVSDEFFDDGEVA